MEQRPRQPARPTFETETASGRKAVVFGPKKERPNRTPKAHKICEGVTEGLLYFMVVFTPWAFGTTQEWSIWTMNAAGWLLGLVLAAKVAIRRVTGYQPPRWGDDMDADGGTARALRWVTRLMAVLTVLFLGYCLISALNARAAYSVRGRHFEYRECIRWLPHSYDALTTLKQLAMYVGWACFFWAARDWLLGKTSSERRAKSLDPVEALAGVEGPPEGRRSGRGPFLPDRARRLLWVLCLNGSLLALECVLQRLSQTNKLLWLVQPRINRTADLQFGPYAYRSNAATYFNLLWPLCLGFWSALSREKRSEKTYRVGAGSHTLLLPGAVLMAACPIISTSRAAAMVSVAQIILVTGVLLVGMRKEKSWLRLGILAVSVVILGLAGYLGWDSLKVRFEDVLVDNMSQRTEIYKNATPITKDFPVFGTGPGTFGWIYQLYRGPNQAWQAYLHDDWMELRITLGWVGFGMVLALLVLAGGRYFLGGGLNLGPEMASMTAVSVLGCLAHARVDFPFQIYSLVLLFLLLCVFLMVTGMHQPSRRT